MEEIIIEFYNYESNSWLSINYWDTDNDGIPIGWKWRYYISHYGLSFTQNLLEEIRRAVYKYEVDHGIIDPVPDEEWYCYAD